MFQRSKNQEKEVTLTYDLTDTAGVLENKVLAMFHGLDG